MGSLPGHPRAAAGADSRPLSRVPARERSPLVIFGTGALACAIGARLARAGDKVALVGTWTAAREAIARRGVVVHEPGCSWSAPLETAPLEEPPEGCPLALVLVKSHQTGRVAPALARALAPEGLAVTLQNGLGHRQALEGTLGPYRVAVGVALLGARLLGPGEVRVVPGRILLGEEKPTATAVHRLAERLRAAGQDVETTREIDRAIWAKLAANCGINPLSALLRVTNGALLDDPETRRLLRAAALEVAAVAAGRGIALADDPAALAEQVAAATATNDSSMRQDLERGSMSEIDVLNGAVVAEGRRLGVPTPVNERLWRGVREQEGRPMPEPTRGPRARPAGRRRVTIQGERA